MRIMYHRRPPRVIGLTFPPSRNGPHPFARRRGCTQALDYTTLLPLLVRTETIDKVLDLRDGSVADCFAQEATALRNHVGEATIPVFPFRKPLNTFNEILPELLVQERGGGQFTRIVGDWLRRIGVNALIFPSARSDCGVHIINGQMVDYIGWNLVDYRGAPPIGNLIFTSDRDHWFNRVRVGPGTTPGEEGGSWIELEDISQYIAPVGESQGTWQIHGLKDWRQKQIKQLLKEVDDGEAPC